MPSDWRNLITARLWAWFFRFSTLLQPKRCLLAHCSTCNALFRDLPESSIHLCWQWKVLILGLHVMASFAQQEIVRTFHSSYFYLERHFSNTSWFVLLCNESNIADREGQWILQFQTITGAHSTITFFIMATMITGMLFEQFLICTQSVNNMQKMLTN